MPTAQNRPTPTAPAEEPSQSQSQASRHSSGERARKRRRPSSSGENAASSSYPYPRGEEPPTVPPPEPIALRYKLSWSLFYNETLLQEFESLIENGRSPSWESLSAEWDGLVLEAAGSGRRFRRVKCNAMVFGSGALRFDFPLENQEDWKRFEQKIRDRVAPSEGSQLVDMRVYYRSLDVSERNTSAGALPPAQSHTSGVPLARGHENDRVPSRARARELLQNHIQRLNERQDREEASGTYGLALIIRYHCVEEDCANAGEACFIEDGLHYRLSANVLYRWSERIKHGRAEIENPRIRLRQAIKEPGPVLRLGQQDGLEERRPGHEIFSGETNRVVPVVRSIQESHSSATNQRNPGVGNKLKDFFAWKSEMNPQFAAKYQEIFDMMHGQFMTFVSLEVLAASNAFGDPYWYIPPGLRLSLAQDITRYKRLFLT